MLFDDNFMQKTNNTTYMEKKQTGIFLVGNLKNILRVLAIEIYRV